MAERLKKGNVWMVCVNCGHREQMAEEQAVGTSVAPVCPECGQNVLNVETKATKGWTG